MNLKLRCVLGTSRHFAIFWVGGQTTLRKCLFFLVMIIGRKKKTSFKTTCFSEKIEYRSAAKTNMFWFSAVKTGRDWMEEDHAFYDMCWGAGMFDKTFQISVPKDVCK